MTYINLNASVYLTNIFNYIPNLFSDIRVDIDILLTLCLIINTLLAFSIVFLEYQTTHSSWAWILVLFLIPYLGFVLYLMFGRPIYREKIFPLSKIVTNSKKCSGFQNLFANLKNVYVFKICEKNSQEFLE